MLYVSVLMLTSKFTGLLFLHFVLAVRPRFAAETVHHSKCIIVYLPERGAAHALDNDHVYQLVQGAMTDVRHGTSMLLRAVVCFHLKFEPC